MNVKTGDLAIIVRGLPGSASPHIGKIVRVGVMQAPQSIYGPIWWVHTTTPIRSVSYSSKGEHLGVNGPSTEVGCPDAWLRRIDNPGEDAADESAAWLPPVPTHVAEPATEGAIA